MNYWESHTQVAVRFRRFDRKRYAAFRSMHKVINIGVVTASTLLFALPDTAQAQKVIEPNRTGEEASVELEEVEVTASRAPIARNQATKIVTVIPAREIAAAPVTSIQDLLEYAAGIDVRQRGEGGTQADISIRGGTFDQIAVLLNGVNLSNPQTGHYSFDLPVNLSDIERIEVVSGPSSVYSGPALSPERSISSRKQEKRTGSRPTITPECISSGNWRLPSIMRPLISDSAFPQGMPRPEVYRQYGLQTIKSFLAIGT